MKSLAVQGCACWTSSARIHSRTPNEFLGPSFRNGHGSMILCGGIVCRYHALQLHACLISTKPKLGQAAVTLACARATLIARYAIRAVAGEATSSFCKSHHLHQDLSLLDRSFGLDQFKSSCSAFKRGSSSLLANLVSQRNERMLPYEG